MSNPTCRGANGQAAPQTGGGPHGTPADGGVGRKRSDGRGTPPRPVALPVLPANIPAELRGRRQWVVWRFELAGDRWTKVPYRPVGSHASSTAPATWSTFAEVLAAYRAGGWDGVGLIHLHADRLTGVDLDKCRDPQS